MMVARDLVIAEAICRHFWWHTLMLWPDELPPGTVLSLSLHDELVPSELVQKQLEDAAARAAGADRHAPPADSQNGALDTRASHAAADVNTDATSQRGAEAGANAGLGSSGHR